MQPPSLFDTPRDPPRPRWVTVILVVAVIGLVPLGAWLDADTELDVARELSADAIRTETVMAERERLRAELLPHVRAAYQQGLDDGAERERARQAARNAQRGTR